MLTISRQNLGTSTLLFDHLQINNHQNLLYLFISRPTNHKMANIQNPAAPQLSEEDKKKQTWGEYGQQVYNEQYERWMPWIEDFYLRWFTRDNKTSYAAKGQSAPPSI